jgi:hypothetical protein
MTTFLLFLITGIVTLLAVMYVLAGAWMGVPVIATEYASIVGSCVLISSAYVSLFSKKRASIMACLGLICVGSFWFIEPIKALISGDAPAGLIVVPGFIWLMMAGSLREAIKGIGATSQEEVRNRFRKGVLSVSAALLLIAIVGIKWQHEAGKRTPSRYEIPDRYVGWVEIQYDTLDASVAPVKDKHLVFAIPASGLLKTSSSQQYGEAHDQYFYCVGSNCRELVNTGWGEGGMIWAESSGTFEERDKPEVRMQQFFVGTELQYKKMQELSTMQQGIVPGDIRAKLP